VEWVETTGRSIEEAKDAALDQLGVDENEAEFEVLEEPRTGLFGRVRGEARIRARVRPARPRPKVERRDRGRRRDRPGKADSEEGGGDVATPAPAAAPADSGRSGSGRRNGGAANEGGAARPAPRAGGEREGRGRRSEGQPPSRGRRPGRAAATDVEPDADDAATNARGTGAAAAEGRAMSDEDVTVEQQAELTEEFLVGLLDAFGVSGEIERTEVDEDTLEVHVSGGDLGLLIGPKGQTLTAVQDLARTYVQRKATGVHQGRVRIDVGGYRQRRREALQRFVRQVAAEVQASEVQKALEPMVASDRKVVHDEVNTIDGVRTISEGEEPRRRVVIVPE
jgi:spoIIIJ-associated protein